jgi:hypothetical protein
MRHIFQYTNGRRQTYEIAKVDKGGNLTYRGYFNPGGRGQRGEVKNNWCTVGMENIQREGRHYHALECGGIVVDPPRQGLGSLLLYHVLTEAYTKHNVQEFHLTDNHNPAAWDRIFENIRIANLPGDPASDVRAPTLKAIDNFRRHATKAGWQLLNPGKRIAAQNDPHPLAKLIG